MIDLQNFNKTIYLKNNFLIRTLKINDIKQGYVESLQDPNVNKYFPMDLPRPVPPPVIKIVLSLKLFSFNMLVLYIYLPLFVFTCLIDKILDRF